MIATLSSSAFVVGANGVGNTPIASSATYPAAVSAPW
jgi:hypothetical protein